MLDKLRELALRYEDLEAQLSDPAVYGDAARLRQVNRERKELESLVETYQAYLRAEQDKSEAEELLRDPDKISYSVKLNPGKGEKTAKSGSTPKSAS